MKPLIWGALAAILACALPPALEYYFPAHDVPRTVIISSPPVNPSGSTPPSPPAPPPTALPSTSQQATLTADEIRTLVDVWRSVTDQMNEIISLTNAGQT